MITETPLEPTSAPTDALNIETPAPVEAPKPAETPAPTDTPVAEVVPEEIPTEYPDYGDSNANAVVSMLVDAKVEPGEAYALFKEAMSTGDFSKVDMKTLTDKLGKAKAELAVLGAKTYYETQTKVTKEICEAAYAATGGEANYTKVQQWARDKSSKDSEFAKVCQGFNQMFDLNATAASMAAKELLALYEKDKGNSSLNNKQISGTSAVTTSASNGEYINRSDYVNQLKEAYNKNDTHEISRLRALRAASLKTSN